ncbi:MAG TPA: tetratricopeptide repeat protein [Pyrinomonadaceae bacterium]|nr:tetratricopeptide repeat protein [Pyrinomonadaceae bacterium]
MKRCPACQRVYADDTLKFCRACGTPLGGSSPRDDSRPTLMLPTDAGGEGATEILDAAAASGEGATSSSLTNSSQLTRTLTPARRRRASARRAIDSLAVLPLANASQDPQAEYLCDGITESIINSLSQLPKLRVVPRATVFRYKGRDADPLAAGREMDVRGVLTGRLLKVGELLVVSAELVDVALDAQIWGEQFRYELADIFALQERISQEISAKMRLRLTGEEKRRLGKRHTASTEAYHLYLKGRYCLNKRATEWIRKGIEHFERAIELDPAFALAHAGLADAYAFLASSTGEQPPAEFYPKSEAAARRALELDDTLAEAHTSLGFYRLLFEWDFRGAAREFRRAIELNPNYANAHDGLSFYYKATAQHERAVRACREAQRIDPLSLFAGVSLGWAFYFARRYEEAIAQNRKALELDPRFIFAHWNTGMAQSQAGKHDEAVASLRRAVKLSGGGLAFKAHLAYACGRAKNCGDEARALIGELEGHACARYVQSYYFAVAHLGLGEHDDALEYLSRAADERSGFLAYLRVEPMFDPLRPDPRFKELEQRVGRAR